MTQDIKPKSHKGRLALVGSVILVAAVAAVVGGITSRAESEQTLEVWTNAQAVPTVAVVAPEANKGVQDLTLPGTIQAFLTAPIYGRVGGYVKKWNFDIGAKVQKGQELAEIDAPDVDHQLMQAQAALASAVAAEKLSAVTAVRWHALLGYQTVSQQAADEKVTDEQAKQAAVQAAQADVGRLQAQAGFEHLIAPFDGVVTARSTDVGNLVNPGSASGVALFQVSDLHKVRIYVQMPQGFAGVLKPGLEASLALPQYPDKTFEATLVATSNSFSEASRTVMVELQADNPDGKLWPGTYTEVMFHVPADTRMLRVPSTALVFGPHGMQVATLGGDNKVLFKPVKLGPDLGNEAEILAGITLTDRVILSPPEWLSDGDVVQLPDAATAAAMKVADQTTPVPSPK
ncbi:efflux RND transporter periplasmic adaptor subunit [Acidisphaera sp. L21]|uniref:efflux RND transporter periplasmic adaptor subunit n=1 Tax=Acidisphaera sp. L21 TaxID=1641851 RepID=UPI00131A8BC7|nr:efflux RND transporter periplasmic adaptor subunit [Acidisphaera sp. L21]